MTDHKMLPFPQYRDVIHRRPSSTHPLLCHKGGRGDDVLLQARLDDLAQLLDGGLQRARVVQHHHGPVLDVVKPALTGNESRHYHYTCFYYMLPFNAIYKPISKNKLSANYCYDYIHLFQIVLDNNNLIGVIGF